MKKKRTLPVLFLTLMLDMIGTAMVIPIIPIIFTDPSSPSFLLTGYPEASWFIIAGLITAVFGIMQFIAAPILGELSDQYGRKRLLTVGVAVLALSQLLFGYGIEAGSLALILFARTIAGLAGANFSIAQAAIADVTEPKDRAKNFGLIGAAFGIGFILGPVLSGLIAGAAGNPSAPFWFAGALGLVNVVFISLFLPETHHARRDAGKFNLAKGVHNIQAAFKDKDARPVYLASFLYMSGFSFFTSFIGVMLVSRFAFTEATIGSFFGVVGAAIVVTQLFILRILSKAYSERAILRVSIPLVALTIVGYAFVWSPLYAFFLIPLMAVPQGLTMANMNALVSKSVSAERQGAALGINGSLLALSQGIVPLLAGVVSGFIGLSAPFLIGAGFMVLAAVALARKKHDFSVRVHS